jgi:hypothetical protein
MIRRPRLLAALLIGNAIASAAHFADNALRFEHYPEPTWITGPAVVDRLWFAITPLLALAWWLATRNRKWIALGAVATYAVLSLFTLGHYVYASPMELSFSMNALIVLEATFAALLLALAPLAIGARSAR